MNKVLKVGSIEVQFIWFDSLGAKCSSIFIGTPDIKILIDPGAAGMQPGYPLPSKEKRKLREKALENISFYSKKADFVFISHYHYDHHTLISGIPRGLDNFYENKIIFAKNPNTYINFSQFKRARKFFEEIFRKLKGKGTLYTRGKKFKDIDFEKELHLAFTRDYGEYTPRKSELLIKGKKWLFNLKKIWKEKEWVNSFEFKGGKIIFVDGKEFKYGNTTLKFTPPLFHGMEYDRIGWVVGVVVKYKRKKFIYTSDLQGPQIEDYAEWIVKENPDAIVLDGFPTYLFGFMVNRINLERAKENLTRIIKNTKANPIIYDHHLVRDIRYRELFKEIYKLAKGRVVTAAEYMGDKPLIEKIIEGKKK